MTGNDTIAAVSTAPGEGGIGIVRVSGDKAAEILGKIFKMSDIDFADKTMYYGHIQDPSSSETVDEALVVFMKGPKSYTGEDVCEIQCHGGGVPLRRILDIVCGLGAVPAQPGEFTKRAFLNGRIDLAQAGAVIDLIRSKTELGYHAAKEQAEGKLSERVRAVRELLLGALAEIAVRIDYPEAFYDEEFKAARTGVSLRFVGGEKDKSTENTRLLTAGSRRASPMLKASSRRELGDLHCESLIPRNTSTTQSSAEHRQIGENLRLLASQNDDPLSKAAEDIRELLEGASAGRLIKDGVRVVIIGKPNTGKSSLFNAMVREEAAIVTATPGTTRDAIEIWLDVRGVPVLLSDTAGIREGAENIEELGIKRAKEQYRKSDVSILLLDGSEKLSDEDLDIAKLLDPEKKLIVAINKTDLPKAFEKSSLKTLSLIIDEKEILDISLINDEYSKTAVEQIEQKIEDFVLEGVNAGSSLLVTKIRHKGLLEKALGEIEEAQSVLSEGKAPEFAEINLRSAWNALGEITGETATGDIIDRVFEEFCVGK